MTFPRPTTAVYPDVTLWHTLAKVTSFREGRKKAGEEGRKALVGVYIRVWSCLGGFVG